MTASAIMKDASTQAVFGTALRVLIVVPVLGLGIECAAQERTGMPIARSFPFTPSVVAGTKSVRADQDAKLSGPVMDPIAPDARSQSSLVLPERRTIVDEMLQSHEFKFGTKPKASNLAAKAPPVGTNMDLDAVKLRISRDKVLIKAEWTFN